MQLSDTERRVLGHLRAPHDQDGDAFSDQEIAGRVLVDGHTDVRVADDVLEHLKDLEAVGYCRHGKQGWKMTQAGFSALTEG